MNEKILAQIRQALSEQGIDLDEIAAQEGEARVKVVCVPADLRGTVDEIANSLRGHVVMVRVDEHTSTSLDTWVETGAVKSRSEAAALFMKEGLRLRESELRELETATRDVARARKSLREKAQQVLGDAAVRGTGKEKEK